ncbi:hypothetical protein [Salinigranum salinum]|nr:hypothetical protein [Salinigranum salinum]
MVRSSRIREVAGLIQYAPVNAAADAERLDAPCGVETDTGGVDDGEY